MMNDTSYVISLVMNINLTRTLDSSIHFMQRKNPSHITKRMK